MQNFLSRAFPVEWYSLTATERGLLVADFADLLREEYDVPDDTMPACIQAENTGHAAAEYARRIGRGNLAAYVACLAAAAAKVRR